MSLILIDSLCRKDNSHYPQVFLEKYKYVVTKIKMAKFIIDGIEISSDDSYNEDSDEENSDEKSLMKKIKCKIC